MIEQWLAYKPMKKVGDYLEIESESFERFAWLPKRMSNNKLIWLHKFIEVRHYADLFGRPPLHDNYYSAYYTPKDYTLALLKGNKFNFNEAVEFCGTPRHHKQKNFINRIKIISKYFYKE